MLFLNVTHILKQINVTEKGFIYSCCDRIVASVWLCVCANVKYSVRIIESMSTQTSGPYVSTATQVYIQLHGMQQPALLWLLCAAF